MVIYLSKKREVILKVTIFSLLFIFICSLSYFLSYIKYDDKRYIQDSKLILENERLKKELSNIGIVSYKDGVVAKVILRDMYSFYDEIVLNVGSKDNVEVSDAVINDDGLIGIVTNVDKNRCNVKLLSSSYNISVRVDDTYGNLNNGIITMIDKYSDVDIGDKIYTSGLDDVPGDVYVGEVINVSLDKDELGKEIKVKLVDNKYLNYVYIVGSIE